MRERNRINLSAVHMFNHALSQYETAMAANPVDPDQLRIPGQHLQSALNRLLTATIPDSFQMMIALTDRILTGHSAYQEQTLVHMVVAPLNQLFKDAVSSILLTLIQVIKEKNPTLDHVWRNQINQNEAIVQFLYHYPTSHQARLAKCPATSLHKADLASAPVYADQSDILLALTRHQTDIHLTGLNPPIVQFMLGEDWVSHPDMDETLPRVYVSQVKIQPAIKRFMIPKSIPLTNMAKAIGTSVGCLDMSTPYTQHHIFVTPAPFFSCCLDLVSFTNGTNWEIGNIQILPPS